MWMWLAAAWCGISIVLAVLHHRLRRGQPSMPPEVQQFLLRFETELVRFPHVEYLGLLPGQFACLLRVRGQETPLALHEMFRRCEAFPDAFGTTVEQLLAEIDDVALDRLDDHDFGAVATDLLPQVRSMEWVEAQGRFGDSALVYRKLNEHLATVYVIDDPQTMVFVCRAHLQRWHREVEDLHQLALANLRRRGGDVLQHLPADQPLLLQTGDGYDAARVLLLPEQDGMLVAIPDRDLLWVGNERGQDLATLMARAESMAQQAPHPVSDRLFRLRDGQLEAVTART
ncbi:MAG: DUF1444 family protein [Planctomycetota bacterium]